MVFDQYVSTCETPNACRELKVEVGCVNLWKFRQITYLWLMLEYGHKSHLKHFSPSWVFLWTFKVYLSGNDFPHILQCRALSDVCNFCMCNLKSVLRPHVVGHWKKNVSKFVTILISPLICHCRFPKMSTFISHTHTSLVVQAMSFVFWSNGQVSNSIL